MSSWTNRAKAAGHRTAEYAKRARQPLVGGMKRGIEKGSVVVRDYPEVALLGGAGYVLGKVVDDTPVLGWITGGNGKWIGAGVGAFVGYNKALWRRSLRNTERAMADVIRK